ncbi:Expansin-A7 [Vitis vinifera]|uniref:Expansin n=1 Tax=Vitis vinifera TaxID=29760 RepID=A0A438BL57_VITVI|nr:Expansin-A7 [Vitis vinifera]
MSVENHANMAASYPSSTSPPHHSHFPSTFPHAHPYLTHVPSLLQWAEIHPAPPASSSAASTPRTASSPPCSLSLSLSQWFFSSFFPLLHSSPFSPWFMLESSAFTPMVPLRQPPPSSSPPPTSARLDYALPSDNGGWCNSPCPHFNLAMLVFLKIAGYRAGIVPVAFRRVPC